MLTPRRAAILALLLPGSVAAQDNPFALTGGSVKTAYIVYEVSAQKQQPGAAPTYEMGVAADRMIMRMVMPFEAGGKKDTLRSFVVATQGLPVHLQQDGWPAKRRGERRLEASLGPGVCGAGCSGKARFRENIKLATQLGGGSDADAFVTLFGEQGRLGDHRRPEVRRVQDEQDQRLRHAGGPHGDAPVGGPEPGDDAGRQKGHPERSAAAGNRCPPQGGHLEARLNPRMPTSSPTSGRSRTNRPIPARFRRLPWQKMPSGTWPVPRPAPSCGRWVRGRARRLEKRSPTRRVSRPRTPSRWPAPADSHRSWPST